MLRATTACTFSASQLLKVVREWCVLYILTSKCASRHNGVHFFDISTSKSGPDLVCLYILTCKCASRHNGVQFFISHLASWLRTRRFSEPTFRPSGATNHSKNTVFRDVPTFSRTCIFFLLIFFSSDSSHLCFSTVHTVGSFTSKLSSNNNNINNNNDNNNSNNDNDNIYIYIYESHIYIYMCESYIYIYILKNTSINIYCYALIHANIHIYIYM